MTPEEFGIYGLLSFVLGMGTGFLLGFYFGLRFKRIKGEKR
jgi:hypothetical protein